MKAVTTVTPLQQQQTVVYLGNIDGYHWARLQNTHPLL